MTTRRSLVLGGACLAGAAAAYGLEPRKHVRLLSGAKMEAVIPTAFPGWSAEASNGLVAPKSEGLAATLYNEVIQRTYSSASERAAVMLLAAYGGVQSDLLQLHRPEVCYPALGFVLTSKEAGSIPMPQGQVLPVVRLVAAAGDRLEHIVYWTRLGEDLPIDGTAQRRALLADAMKGFIPDGVLVRASVVASNSADAFRVLDRFVIDFLHAIPGRNLKALIGTRLATALNAHTA